MRAIRAIVLTILAIPVLLAVGGFGVLVWFTSTDQIRPRLIAAARDAGYTLDLAEPAQIAIGVTPAFRLSGMRLGQTGREPFVVANELSAKVSLLGLFSGRLDIGEVILDGPVIRLDLLPEDRGGARTPPPPRDARRAGPVEEGEAFLFTLAGLRLTGLRVLSGPNAPVLEIPRLELAAPDPARPVTLSGEIRAIGAVFAFDGEAGPWGEMLAGRPPRSARFAMGAADLSALRPGLRVERIALSAESLDQPATLEGAGALGGLPWRIVATSPAPAALAAGRGGAFRIEASFGEARLAASGTVTEERLAAEATLTTPALAPLGAAAGVAVPAATAVTASLRLDLPEQGPIRIQGATLTADQLRATADLTVTRGARPRVAGEATVARLDLDALQPAAAGTPARPAAPPARRDRLIPDLPLPMSGLDDAEGDVRVTIAALRSGGQDYGPISGRAVLSGGRLLLDPLSLGLPAGVVAGRAEARADGRVALRLAHQGAGLDMARLLPLTGLAAGATRGNLELDLDLAGRGQDLRAVAASLSGHLGLAMVGGQLDNAVLRALGADIARLFGVQDGGVTPLSCLALRAPAAEGVLRTEVLLVETALGTVSGAGQVALGTEQIALRLLPRLAFAGLSVAAPVLVGGTLAAPRVGLDPQGAGAAVADLLQRRGGAGAAPECATALAAARGGRPGPAAPAVQQPAPQPAPGVPLPGQQQQAPSRPQDLLRQLPGLLGR
jgi:AsmA protein